MRSLPRLLLVAPMALGATVLYSTPKAHAQDEEGTGRGVDACGDVYVEAEANCEVIAPSVDCETQCTEASVEASCAADLVTDCDKQCTETVTEVCTETCQERCVTDCEIDPGSFDCTTTCQADCNAGCETGCATDDSECWASCTASCSASCETECVVVPPSANCETQCSSCCQAECHEEVNRDCKIDCQTELFVECSAEVTLDCMTDCQSDEGALFCDGEYVDHGGNLEECIDGLKDALDIDVDLFVDAECDDNSCDVDAGGAFSCGVGGADSSGALAGWLLIGLAVVFGVSRRKLSARGARRGPQ